MNELPSGWERMRLAEISTRTKNVDPKKFPGETFELYSVPSFLTGSPEVVPSEEIGSTKQAVQTDDILLCKIVPHINRVWTVGQPENNLQIASGEWIVYRDHYCDPSYLQYCLSEASFRSKFLATSSGVGGSLTRARPAEVANIEIPIAPLAEQRRIVGKVDSLIARTARSRKELDRIPTLIARYKQRLLALAFSGELTAGWRADHELPEPVPTAVEDLSEGLRYGTAKKSYAAPNGVAVLRIPNVVSGRISLEDLKYSELEPKELAKLRLNEGDILVVRSNGSVDLVGRPALVTGGAVGLAYAGYLIRIRPKHDLVVPKFLTLMLEAPAIRNVIEAGARSTSGVNNVNATELGALTVPLFDIDEQMEVVRRIESAFGWLERMAADHAAAARLLPKLDAAILAKAFQGRLVPQNPDDEPASVLLDRIKAQRVELRDKPKKSKSEKSQGTIVESHAGPMRAEVVRPGKPVKVSAMSKSRRDDDVWQQPYLAKLLKSKRTSDPQTLFKFADLPVADFYKQLAWEIDNGHIIDDTEELKAA